MWLHANRLKTEKRQWSTLTRDVRINWKYSSDFSLKNGIFFDKSKKNTRVARNVLKVWKKEEK